MHKRNERNCDTGDERSAAVSQTRLNYERIPGENKGFLAQVICNGCYGRSGGTWAGSYSAAERIEAKAWNRRANDEKID